MTTTAAAGQGCASSEQDVTGRMTSHQLRARRTALLSHQLTRMCIRAQRLVASAVSGLSGGLPLARSQTQSGSWRCCTCVKWAFLGTMDCDICRAAAAGNTDSDSSESAREALDSARDALPITRWRTVVQALRLRPEQVRGSRLSRPD